jgi:hypothetical protein
MAKERTIQHPDAVYVVSNRTIEGKAFMRPDRQVNAIIERTLAWAVDKHCIELFGFLFEADQFAMVLSAPHLNREKFMQDFQSVVGRELKDYIGRTEKGFWAGPYDDELVLDEVSVAEEVVEILCGPCKLELVDHPRDWPGVSSWRLHEHGSSIFRQREDRRRFWELRQKHPEMSETKASRLATVTYELSLMPLPEAEAGKCPDICEMIEARIDDQRSSEQSSLGAEQVAKWNPHRKPPRRRRRRRRRCITRCKVRLERHIEYRRDLNHQYVRARGRLQRGDPEPNFPFGMIPPHRPGAVGATRPDASRPPPGPRGVWDGSAAA